MDGLWNGRGVSWEIVDTSDFGRKVIWSMLAIGEVHSSELDVLSFVLHLYI